MTHEQALNKCDGNHVLSSKNDKPELTCPCCGSTDIVNTGSDLAGDNLVCEDCNYEWRI